MRSAKSVEQADERVRNTFERVTKLTEVGQLPQLLYLNGVRKTLKAERCTMHFDRGNYTLDFDIPSIAFVSMQTLYGIGLSSTDFIDLAGVPNQEYKYLTMIMPLAMLTSLQVVEGEASTTLVNAIGKWSANMKTAADNDNGILTIKRFPDLKSQEHTVYKGYACDFVLNDVTLSSVCTIGRANVAVMLFKCQKTRISQGLTYGPPSSVLIDAGRHMLEVRNCAIPLIVDMRALRYLPLLETGLGKMSTRDGLRKSIVKLTSSTAFGFESPRNLVNILEWTETCFEVMRKEITALKVDKMNADAHIADMANGFLANPYTLSAQSGKDPSEHFSVREWTNGNPTVAAIHCIKCINTAIILAWLVAMLQTGSTFTKLSESTAIPRTGIDALKLMISETWGQILISNDDERSGGKALENTFKVMFEVKFAVKIAKIFTMTRSLAKPLMSYNESI